MKSRIVQRKQQIMTEHHLHLTFLAQENFKLSYKQNIKCRNIKYFNDS